MAKTAVNYLYEKGHSNILFITDDLQSEVASERYIGYLKGCIKLGLESHQMLLFDRSDPINVEELMQTISKKKNDSFNRNWRRFVSQNDSIIVLLWLKSS